MRNGGAAPVASVPVVPAADFRAGVLSEIAAGSRLVALFGTQSAHGATRLCAVLADGGAGVLSLAAADVGESYPALTPECPQAHLFEREIAEECGVVPLGHPWLKPVRRPGRPSADVAGEPLPGVADFFEVQGDEVHEVAVGPIHAGVIEPGHFRFQCHGENVLHLEIALGYQHRGAARALGRGPTRRSIHYAETLAGDTTIAHATAYCEAVEALAGCRVPARAQALRGIALELERLANHTGDLGALAGDVGYLPTAAYCGRLRGDFLNLTALVCGSRFGRGWVRPGGAAFDVDEMRATEMLARLTRAFVDVEVAVRLLWESPSVQARFEDTGVLSRETCRELGLVGPAARASGLPRDARAEFPSGIWRFAQIPVSTGESGDVLARAMVRWLEIQRSTTFLKEQIAALPPGAIRSPIGSLAPGRIVATLVEGWRGEICHVAVTDETGRFATYRVVDPSFHNWAGLAQAMRSQQISDFPLCNKSFNLSYCGHDL
jgi:Ni,Fe-hydrogenase III large subunit